LNSRGFFLKAKTGENVTSRRILHFHISALLAVMNTPVTDRTMPVFRRDPHGAWLVFRPVGAISITNTRATITTGVAMTSPTFYNGHSSVFCFVRCISIRYIVWFLYLIVYAHSL
jgi:hypothetical protein